MGITGVNATTAAYAATYQDTANTKAASEKKETEQTTGAVYEKTPSDSKDKGIYTSDKLKMTAEQRAEVVKQMKADQEKRR